MKKILILILSLFLISSCSSKINISEENYEKVGFDVILDKINNDESFIYYIGSDECSACKQYLKDLDKYFNKHSEDKIYYVDVTENFLVDKPYNEYRKELANIAYYFDYEKEINGHEKDALYTPTTFQVINGEYTFAMIGNLIEVTIENLYDMEFNNIKYNELNYDQSITMLEGEDDFNFFLTNNNCSSCLEFKLFVNSFAKQEKEVKLNYLSLTDDIIKDEEKLLWLKTFIANNLGTPININDLEINVPTLIKKRNGVISISEGVPSKEEFKEFLK